MINLSYSALFKRKVALDIQVNNIIKTYSDAVVDKFNLKIDFNITKSMGSLGDRGSITITGLPLEDAGALSTCMMNIGKEAPPRNYVQLMAGYESDFGVIFKGGVFKVSSNLDTPDMSVTLDVKPGYDASRITNIEINEKPATLMSICQKAASVLEAPLNFTAEDTQLHKKRPLYPLLGHISGSKFDFAYSNPPFLRRSTRFSFISLVTRLRSFLLSSSLLPTTLSSLSASSSKYPLHTSEFSVKKGTIKQKDPFLM